MIRSPIPWNEIDPEIRPLMRLLNDQPGVQTLYSCAGHESDPGPITYGYVVMNIDCLDNLIGLVQKIGIDVLTSVRWPAGNRLSSAYIECGELRGKEWVSAEDDECYVAFTLHIEGQPLQLQRKKLRKIEEALK